MSISSEITRISNNVQNTIDTIGATGVTVPDGANSDDLPSLAQALANTKQDKLTGTKGQFVGFTADNVVGAVDAPTGTMIVNVTSSGGSVTADKTVAEIQEAVDAGYSVIASINGLVFAPLFTIQSREVVFATGLSLGGYIDVRYNNPNAVVANELSVPSKASDLLFNKGTTGLTATNVQAAIEEVNEKIPSAPKSVTVTLPASGWSSNTQTVTVSGVLADETKQLIQPMPAMASQSAYYGAGILCTNQAANSLTFTCQEAPSSDLTVYVVIQGVTA